MAASQTPLLQPLVKAEQSLGTPPRQAPPEQVLLTMQRSPSFGQVWPSLPGWGSHWPVAGLQTPTWQASGTGAKKQSFGAPTHWPFWQVSLTTQRSSVESHGLPFASGTLAQLCVASLQVTLAHSAALIPQSWGPPPTQNPFSHASPTVQKSPSSQASPPVVGTTLQACVPGSHTAVRHCGVSTRLQSSAQPLPPSPPAPVPVVAVVLEVESPLVDSPPPPPPEPPCAVVEAQPTERPMRARTTEEQAETRIVRTSRRMATKKDPEYPRRRADASGPATGAPDWATIGFPDSFERHE